MPQKSLTSNEFQKLKSKTLSKKDKSDEGKWDDKIAPLCRKINFLPDFFTTSSCAGRIMLIKGKMSKIPQVFLYKTHNIAKPSDFSKHLKKHKNEDSVYFKQDPCALHVACRTLEHALALVKLARNLGWKKSGIISSKKRYICEMTSTESLSTPVIIDKKILISEEYLKILVNEANKKLQRTWKKIKKLEENLHLLKKLK